MTDLTSLNLNPNVEENKGAFIVLPEGQYKAVLIKDELKENSKNTGKILNLTFQITDGVYKGNTVKTSLNMTNTKSPVAGIIGQGTLKKICNICNVVYPPNNLEGLRKELVITIQNKDEISKKTGKTVTYNNIVKYDSISSAPVNQPQTPDNSSKMEW